MRPCPRVHLHYPHIIYTLLKVSFFLLLPLTNWNNPWNNGCRRERRYCCPWAVNHFSQEFKHRCSERDTSLDCSKNGGIVLRYISQPFQNENAFLFTYLIVVDPYTEPRSNELLPNSRKGRRLPEHYLQVSNRCIDQSFHCSPRTIGTIIFAAPLHRALTVRLIFTSWWYRLLFRRLVLHVSFDADSPQLTNQWQVINGDDNGKMS